MDRTFDQMRRDVIEWRESADWPESPRGWLDQRVAFDLTEHDDEYVLAIDMPGFETDEIDPVLDGNRLTVSATHESQVEDGSRTRSVSERITVPAEILEEDVSASYRNGVLEVHLPIGSDAQERGYRIDVD